MTEFTPNPEQRELIESVDGIYKVDAGAGTGKTFTITRRYAHILNRKMLMSKRSRTRQETRPRKSSWSLK